MFVFVFILFEHPWHATDVFVRLPECRFNSAIILLPKTVFYFTLVYLEIDRLISSSSMAAGNGVSVTPIGHVVLCFPNPIIAFACCFLMGVLTAIKILSSISLI